MALEKAADVGTIVDTVTECPPAENVLMEYKDYKVSVDAICICIPF